MSAFNCLLAFCISYFESLLNSFLGFESEIIQIHIL
jgi:hypothetical protein